MAGFTAQVDALLGPVHAASRGKTPQRSLMSLAARAASVPIPSGEVLVFTRRLRADDPVRVFAQDDPVTARALVAKSYRFARADHDSFADRISVARRIIGCLATARRTDLTPAGLVSARVAAAAVGVAQLEAMTSRGFDTALVTWSRLALELGVARPTATRWIRQAETARMISTVSVRGGGSRRLRLARLGARDDEATWALADSVEALATGDVSDPLAAWIMTVASPVWGYADVPKLSHRAWLAGAVHLAGLDPVTAGLSKTAYRTQLRLLAEAFGPDWESAPADMDRHCHVLGAAARFAEAKAAYEVEAAAYTLALTRARDARAKAREAVSYLLADFPLPSDSALPAERARWAQSVHELWVSMRAPADMISPVRRRLVSTMEHRGLDTEIVERIISDVQSTG